MFRAARAKENDLVDPSEFSKRARHGALLSHPGIKSPIKLTAVSNRAKDFDYLRLKFNGFASCICPIPVIK